MPNRVILGRWPTPLDDCPRLTEALGGPRILVKRDDVNGLGVGGNKLRKLEYLMGEALEAGADTVITFGALQTNHGRQTAAACARLGLRCELILTKDVARSDETYEKSGNMLLDHLYGAHVHICETAEEAGQVHDRVKSERNAVTFPVGGSNRTGILGYVTAAAEIHDQRADIDKIVVPVGSAGTAAGLALGIKQLNWPVQLIGACVSRSAEQSRAMVEQLVGDVDIQLTDRAVGDGYGVPTRQMWEALRLFASTEGITLDPVYSGKAAAALVDMIRNGEIDDDETVVFVHTGGLPGLFAYAPDLIASD